MAATSSRGGRATIAPRRTTLRCNVVGDKNREEVATVSHASCRQASLDCG
jgi:hypothetical protein